MARCAAAACRRLPPCRTFQASALARAFSTHFSRHLPNHEQTCRCCSCVLQVVFKVKAHTKVRARGGSGERKRWPAIAGLPW